MFEYKSFYITVGIRYPDIDGESEYIKDNNGELIYKWQKEIQEQLDELSAKGFELVQLDNRLLHGAPDGYGIFRRRKE